MKKEEKEPVPVLRDLPPPRNHCLEPNSEVLYNQREETFPPPRGSLEPTEEGPILDSQVASETSSGSGKVTFLSTSTPLPTKVGEF